MYLAVKCQVVLCETVPGPEGSLSRTRRCTRHRWLKRLRSIPSIVLPIPCQTRPALHMQVVRFAASVLLLVRVYSRHRETRAQTLGSWQLWPHPLLLQSTRGGRPARIRCNGQLLPCLTRRSFAHFTLIASGSSCKHCADHNLPAHARQCQTITSFDRS